MIVEKWHKFLYVKSYGWSVEERFEGNSVVEEYELDGIRYDLFLNTNALHGQHQQVKSDRVRKKRGS